MNPNLAQTLDPKLKETYDRIMGTELPKAGSSPAVEPQTHVPIEQIATPQAPTPEATPNLPEESKVEMVSINTTPSVSKTEQVSKGRKISPVIFIVVGVLFFLLYAFAWLKVFKIF